MTKTEFKLKSSRQKLNNLTSLPSLNINNVLIKHSHSSKPLSMLIDENLTCENHVDTIIHYIKENCVWLPINHCLPPAALHAVYYGRQSHFDNCSKLRGSSHAYRVLSTTSSYRPLQGVPPLPQGETAQNNYLVHRYIISTSKHTYSRDHRECKLTFRRITLILHYHWW